MRGPRLAAAAAALFGVGLIFACPADDRPPPRPGGGFVGEGESTPGGADAGPLVDAAVVDAGRLADVAPIPDVRPIPDVAPIPDI